MARGKTLVEALQDMSEAFANVGYSVLYGYEGMARLWEGKMDPDEFERRALERRDRQQGTTFWDVVSILIVAAFTFLVILWIVWGTMA